jgi:hypothetical protein
MLSRNIEFLTAMLVKGEAKNPLAFYPTPTIGKLLAD